MTIRDIARKYSLPGSVMGREPVKQRLLTDLRQHRKLNGTLYGIYFSVALAVSVGAIAVLAYDTVTGAAIRTTILAGAGVTLTGVLYMLRTAVREWSQSNLLIVIATHGDEEQLQRLLDTLLKSDLLGEGGASKGKAGGI